jgi:hypothetical protein
MELLIVLYKDDGYIYRHRTLTLIDSSPTVVPPSHTYSLTVEFVIQILKKAAKLASKAEARRREAWAADRSLLTLGFHLYKYTCNPQEIVISL